MLERISLEGARFHADRRPYSMYDRKRMPSHFHPQTGYHFIPPALAYSPIITPRRWRRETRCFPTPAGLQTALPCHPPPTKPPTWTTSREAFMPRVSSMDVPDMASAVGEAQAAIPRKARWAGRGHGNRDKTGATPRKRHPRSALSLPAPSFPADNPPAEAQSPLSSPKPNKPGSHYHDSPIPKSPPPERPIPQSTNHHLEVPKSSSPPVAHTLPLPSPPSTSPGIYSKTNTLTKPSKSSRRHPKKLYCHHKSFSSFS